MRYNFTEIHVPSQAREALILRFLVERSSPECKFACLRSRSTRAKPLKIVGMISKCLGWYYTQRTYLCRIPGSGKASHWYLSVYEQ